MSYTVRQNDLRPDLEGQVTYPTGTAPTLTDATVAGYLVNKDTGTAKIDGRACTVVIDDSAKTIDWTLAMASGDFDTLGEYLVYIIVTYSDSDTETIIPSDPIVYVKTTLQ